MLKEQLEIMRNNKGFIAALDQSGGSTPKALKLYGVSEDEYKNEEEMFNLVHEMRKRIIKSKNFKSDKIIAAILFEQTMDRKIDGKYTPEYLWEDLGIVPFVKVDEGLCEEKDGVRLMKEMQKLDSVLDRAKERGIFGTKMRSVILENNEKGIEEVVKQQFDYAKEIIKKGFVPIIEPEVDIHAKDKSKIEEKLLEELIKNLEKLEKDDFVIFKLTIPEKSNLYIKLYEYPQTVRLVALSGGYSREEANRRLKENDRMSASFSRALTEGSFKNMSDDEYNDFLGKSIDSIYEASV